MSYKLPQYDNSPTRRAGLSLMQARYVAEHSVGIPLSLVPDGIRDTDGPEWVRQVLAIALRLRGNMETYMAKTKYTWKNPYPPRISNPEFVKFAMSAITLDSSSPIQNFIDTGANVFNFVLPDMGPGGPVSSLADYDALYSDAVPRPEIASRFQTDESFANNFVAGPNPHVIKLMQGIPANFPLTSAHMHAAPGLEGEDLAQAIAEHRVYIIDHSDMSSLKNGSHYGMIPKYTYAPLAAFAVPKNGGKLVPFAIQCGPDPAGRQIYTPQDNFSWKIAKNCVLVAHNIHHELSSHLGLTHYLMEPILMATRRQLSTNHPVYALLNHHFEGTMLINFAATHNLILPTRAVDRLFGCEMTSAYAFTVKERLGYSFTGNFLPSRLNRLGTANASPLSYYPYRDDAMLLWNATHDWVAEYVGICYPTENDIAQDYEIQAWAAEIASPQGGAVKDFGISPGRIANRDDLTNLLAMTAFTAGPQHAAVNFAQGTDMSYSPANPFAGFTPEPTGTGHTMQDWLKNLSPIETAITCVNILNILAGVHYTTYGRYFGEGYSLMSDFSDSNDPVNAAVLRFGSKLDSIETEIASRNTTRTIKYEHLLPSRIPQSVNI